MKAIKLVSKYQKTIHFGKIKPFINICRVTGEQEYCNVEVTYIPKDKVLELGTYRKFFEKGFSMYIEELADHVFEKIVREVNPRYLKVVIFLEDEKLTPWNVTIESI